MSVFSWPPITVSATSASVGINGAAIPGSSDLVGAKDGSGNLQPLNISAAGALKTDSSAVTQPVSAVSLPLPSGAATGAKQDTGNTSLGNIDTSTSAINAKFGSLGQKAMAGSAPVVLASDQTAIPASQSGTWNINNVAGTVSLPTGAATGAKQDTGNTSLSSIDGKMASLGQKAATGSMPVVPASDWVDVPRSNMSSLANNIGTGGSATLLVNGCGAVLCEITGTWVGTLTFSASLDGSVFYNISGISVSSPTTPVSTTTANGVWRFPCSGFKTFKVAMTAFTSGTAVANLVAGQAPASVEVRQSTGGALNANVAATQSGTWTVQPGNTANTTAWLTTQGGRAKANAPIRNDYTSTSVTTGAYVQLVASTTSACNEVEIFDSSGQDLVLAVGGAGSEVDQIGIFPGGNGRVPLTIAASSRISIKAKSATANVGVILINLYA